MKPHETKIVNCYIWPRKRPSETMFYWTPEHGFQANLDGYAIIPKEEYLRLQAEAKRVNRSR